ncbi:MAG: arsenic efflux protein [Bacilli bacterium]|nr:arsenic efflux protein [Bacilli bacterium]
MKEIIAETLEDSLKILPFLLGAFLIMEYFEHKMSKKHKQLIQKSGKLGPLFGGILGIFPQCGFSVVATNLYATRMISLGTLISIYLSTSDEMLSILISRKTSGLIIISLLLIKMIVGFLSGFIIDFLLRNKKKEEVKIEYFCKEEHCNCSHGIFKSSLKHTISIMIFILIISFSLNMFFYYFGQDFVEKLFMKDSIFGPFLASLIGLIPNCGGSVILIELFLRNTLSFASVLAGLLTSSGVALVILFKVNRNFKESVKILMILYSIGVFVGVLFQILELIL